MPRMGPVPVPPAGARRVNPVHHVPRGITMGKALFGAHVDPRSLQLLDEVRSLRERVAELEQALEAAREAAETDSAPATREHATT